MSTIGKAIAPMSVSQLHHAAMEAFDEALALEKAGDVPAGKLADIVKPLWESRVRAIGIRMGKKRVELRDIDLVHDDSQG